MTPTPPAEAKILQAVFFSRGHFSLFGISKNHLDIESNGTNYPFDKNSG